MTLFEALTGGAFDRLFQKSQMPRGLPGGGGLAVLESTGTLFHRPALSIGQKTELSLLRVFVELLQLHFRKCCLPLESLQLPDR